MTNLLENANCNTPVSNSDGGWTLIGNQTTWTSETKNLKRNSNGNWTTGKVLHRWVSSSKNIPLEAAVLSQTIEDMPNGVYLFSASINASMGYGNKQSKGTYIFANDNTVEVRSNGDNPSYQGVLVTVTDGKLKVGFNISSENTCNYIYMGNISLKYLGNLDVKDGPADLSNLIVNADFSATTYNWSLEGEYDSWSGPKGTQWQEKKGTINGTTIENGVERYVSSGKTLSDSKLYQTVNGLPNGKYKLSADFIATQQADKAKVNTGTQLYAETTDGIVYKDASTEDGKSQNFSLDVIVRDGKLQLGVRNVSTTCNWMCVDNFKLEYYGEDLSIYIENLEAKIAEAEAYKAAHSCYSALDESLAKAIADAKTVAKNESATKDDINKAADELAEAKALVEANVQAYDAMVMAKNNVEEALDKYTDEAGYTKYSEIKAYLAADENGNSCNDIIAKRLYDTDAANVYTEKLTTMVKALPKSFSKEGTDVTYLLSDPSFDNGGEGWQGKTTVNSTTNNAEAYHKKFDMYQELSDMPDGSYELSAQAMQRVGEYGSDNLAKYNQGKETITTWLYANDEKTQVNSAYSETMESGGQSVDGKNYVNSMADFQSVTTDGTKFVTTLRFTVTDGKIRFGIKCDDNVNWSIWDNFKLKYIVTAKAAYEQKLTEKLAEAETLKSEGHNVCASVLKELTDAITVVDALKNSESISKEECNSAVDKLEKAMAAYTNNAQAYQQVEVEKTQADVYSDGHYDEEKVAALTNFLKADDKGNAYDAIINGALYDTEAMAAYIAKLQQLELDASATFKNNGVDMTSLLVNPSFTSKDGWTNIGTVNADLQNCEVYDKTFDMFQELTGVPNGTYEISVQAFQRVSDNETAYEQHRKAAENITTCIYGNDMQQKVKSLYADYMTTKADNDFEKDGKFYANSMKAFKTATDNNLYNNVLKVDVTDGTLKLGIKCDTKEYGAEWTIFDNFRLNALSFTFDEARQNIVKTTNGIDVKLVRTLGSGYWNTFCVPFDIDESTCSTLFGDDAIREYDNIDNGVLCFKKVSSITAGKAYLIKPTTKVENPTFKAVNITATEAENNIDAEGYGFQGIYSPLSMAIDGTQLFVTSDGKVSYPTTEEGNANVIKGMRAYIVVPTADAAKSLKLDIDGETTSINVIMNVQSDIKVYNLNGQYIGKSLDGLTKGIYVINGQKKVIK